MTEILKRKLKIDRLSVINRLDRLVSGVVIMATNTLSATKYHIEMSKGRFKKEYVAIVKGHFPKKYFKYYVAH